MKLILLVTIFLFLVKPSATQKKCDDAFGKFLDELKKSQGKTKNAENLANELRDDYYRLVRQCFASAADDSSKCFLADDEIKGDVYGENGPLKGCDRCQKLASSLRDKVLKLNKNDKECFQSMIMKAFWQSLEPCVRGTISNGYSFTVLSIGDWSPMMDSAVLSSFLQAIDSRIAAGSRLQACGAVNPTKYRSTAPCMKNGFPNMYQKHCQAVKDAVSVSVSNQCNARFKEIAKATCTCINAKADDFRRSFSQIQDVVTNAKSASECGQQISDIMGSWMSTFQNTLNQCKIGDADSKRMDLRTLIELGCGQVINGGVKKNELTVGFNFIKRLLDAVIEISSTIFCDKNCDY